MSEVPGFVVLLRGFLSLKLRFYPSFGSLDFLQKTVIFHVEFRPMSGSFLRLFDYRDCIVLKDV